MTAACDNGPRHGLCIRESPGLRIAQQRSRIDRQAGAQQVYSVGGSGRRARSLISPSGRPVGGALAVIDVTDDISSYQIPLGAAAQVAIYTEHWHYVSMIRKILLRIRSWQNYIFQVVAQSKIRKHLVDRLYAPFRFAAWLLS